MTSNLKPRQAETINFIVDYTKKKGYPPSRKDIADEFNVAINGVQDMLKIIEREGFIKITPGIGRGITIKRKKV